PFAVAQKTHLVNGVLGYEAQLVNAVINSRAPITTRLNYEWFGDWSKVNGKTSNADDVGVIVSATMKGETEPRVLSVSMAQVGNVRNSPLWVNDPRQQLAYLATKRWSRLYCPDVILGVYTADEVEDFEPKDVTPQPTTSKTASIRDKVAAKKEATKPKPQVIDAEPAPQDDAAFNDAVQSLEQSQTIDELKAHGKKIAESGFTEAQIADLTIAYKAKLKELQDIAAFEAQEAQRLAELE
ncbi:MAG TPA: recombinase RecT, partial [Agitococcus sp.]|nr:recombinase RecT [Agitococcus sp.]